MSYNLRSRSIIELLRNDDETEEILDENNSEMEDHVSEESEEYDIDSDGNEYSEDEMECELENASLAQRLMNSRARGRPITKLKGKNGFVWDTKIPARQSGMYE